MMHPQQKHDDDIDFALQSLGNATPPQGMEQRLLHRARLVHAPRAKQPPGHFRFAVFATTACAFALLAIWVFPHRERSPAAAPGIPMSADAMQPRPAPGSQRVNVSSNRRAMARIVWSATDHHARMKLGKGQLQQSHANSDAATDAPSQTAPPLPLTPQECLLADAARGRTSRSQIASLRRPVWPLRDPADDEDFRKFFEPQSSVTTDGDNE